MFEALRWVQLACFAWVLWLPVSQPLILYPALALIAGTSLVLWWRDGSPVPRELVVAAVIYYVFVAGMAVFSFAQANPGALHQTVLWAGVPMLWVPWAMSLHGRHMRRTLLVMYVVAGVSSVTVLALAVEALEGPGMPTALKDLQQMWFTISADGQIELAHLGLSSLLGLAAFLLAAAFVPGDDSWLPRRRIMVVLAALAFVAGIISGRRGFAVVVLLAPFLASAYVLACLAMRKDVGVRLSRYVGGVALASVAVAVLMISPLGANMNGLLGLPPDLSIDVASPSTSGPKPDDGSAVGEGDTGSSTDDVNAINDSARADQLPELLEGWRASPVVGQGFGAVLDSGYERSEDRPWMFETQPLQILMNVGLLGYLVLAVLAILVLRVVIRAFGTGVHRPTLVASVITCFGMLVADVTNPYLQAPGHGWAVFLVVGVCASLLRGSAHLAEEDVRDPRVRA